MDDFPAFMQHAANRIAVSDNATPGVEGYVFDGADGSQMAFWTCTQRPGGTIPGILYAKNYPAFDSSSSCTLRVPRRSDRSRCKVVVCRRSQM
jgi:hypothetical protein